VSSAALKRLAFNLYNFIIHDWTVNIEHRTLNIEHWTLNCSGLVILYRLLPLFNLRMRSHAGAWEREIPYVISLVIRFIINFSSISYAEKAFYWLRVCFNFEMILEYVLKLLLISNWKLEVNFADFIFCNIDKFS
jgi:hypothetical protein